MDIYARLVQDHDYQRKLCKQLLNTEGASQSRKDLWDALKLELEAHAAAEEQVFYSKILQRPDLTEKARHSVHEHQEMTKIIKDLDEMELSSTGWLTRFKTLEHTVTHHLDEEEKKIFPASDDVLKAHIEEDMVSEFDQRKQSELSARS